MSEWAVTVRVTVDDSGGAVDGMEPGAPVSGGIVEIARAEGDRDIRSGTPDDGGVVTIGIGGPGAYLINYTRNIVGGALLADARADIEGPETTIELRARAFGLE